MRIVLAILICAACRHAPADEDYAVARSKFHTQLVKRGPAPQGGARETPPAGARELPFSSGGLSLVAWISDGPHPTPRPAVLFLHGGFAFDESDWRMAQAFRDAGYIVMTPILRGEDGLPGTFSLLYDEVDDVLAAADVLAAQPGVDALHLYLAGHVTGGTLALLAAMTSKRFRAVATLSGTSDPTHVYLPEDPRLPFDPERADELRLRSPIAFATSLKCPARLYFGSGEGTASVDDRELASRASAVGLDVEAVSVPGDHITMVEKAIPLAIAFFATQR